MPNDKCPKCGAAADRHPSKLTFQCGSYIYPNGEMWHQSDLCETRCELAELKARHERLVETASDVVDECACFDPKCDCCFCRLKNALVALNVEPFRSESDQPSEKGCPFEEDLNA